MPWDQSYDRIRSLPAAARKVWTEVANRELADHGDEGRAQASGWAAVKNAGYEKAGHRWSKREAVTKTEAQMDGLFKANGKITKAREGDGEMFVTVTASGVRTDRQNEKMDGGFLDKILKNATDGLMGLRESHAAVFDIGKSVGAVLQPSGDADFEFKLDKSNPFSPYLFEKVKKGECDLQASLDGYSTARGFEWDDKLQKMVKVLKDGVIKFVALTPAGESAYPTAGFTEAIVKQVTWDQEPPPPAREGPEKIEKTAPGRVGGGSMEELIKQLEGTAEAISKAAAPSFKLEGHMFENVAGAVLLRKDFQEEYDKSRPTLSKEQVERVEKSMESILNAIGNKTVVLPAKPAAAAPVRKTVGASAKVEVLKKALGLDTLLAEVQEVKKGLATTKGRPAVTGPEGKIRKDNPEPVDMTIEDITKSMSALGAAVQAGKVTGTALDQAKVLKEDFLRNIAANAIREDMASVGVGA